MFIITISLPVAAQKKNSSTIPYISLDKFSDGINHWKLFSPFHNYERLDTSDVIGIAGNLLAYQNKDGGWPKNIDWLAILDPDSVIQSLSNRHKESTFDNRNIYPQIEYLSKLYFYSGIEKYKLSALRGLDYILREQNISGGWKGADVDAITFNDDVMTGIMGVLLDIQYEKEWYNWIDKNLMVQLETAYNNALSTTLRCQILVDGIKTAWCQQHDHETYQPVKARSYELPSISARESTSIVLFLMRIHNPEDSVISAIEHAINWFEEARIIGYRYGKIEIPEVEYHETVVDYDMIFEADSTAQPVWARYYDLKSKEPFLCRRDGTKVYKLEKIEFERRIGYAWYGYWPNEALTLYPEWKKSISDK